MKVGWILNHDSILDGQYLYCTHTSAPPVQEKSDLLATENSLRCTILPKKPNCVCGA